MTRMAKQVLGAALSLSPGHVIDKFLDWLEELSVAILPAQVGGFANCVVRTEPVLDPFNA